MSDSSNNNSGKDRMASEQSPGWAKHPPLGNGPHVAKLRGGNEALVLYTNRRRHDGTFCWSWICQRTKRPVYPLEFRHD